MTDTPPIPEELLDAASELERERCPQWSADICKRALRDENCLCRDDAAETLRAALSSGLVVLTENLEQVGWWKFIGDENPKWFAGIARDCREQPDDAWVPIYRLIPQAQEEK